MGNIKFRKLTEEDIEIRVGNKTANMTMFLLYKNARVDMNILDATVGQDKWFRDHKELKGNLFCGVGIEVEPGKVVWKWDCGTESNTEKEKGEASDSFKRACVNWGIGRELYTTPRIKIANSQLQWSDKGNLITPLSVAHIDYDDTGRIYNLTIIDSENLVELWKMEKGVQTLGIGAKRGNRTALKPASSNNTPVADKPVETGGKRLNKGDLITRAMVENGDCDSVIAKLRKTFGTEIYMEACDIVRQHYKWDSMETFNTLCQKAAHS